MSHAHAIPPESPAPWAEVVPHMPRMTVDEVSRLPDDEWQYELVDGRLVRMPLSGGEASRIGAILLGALITFGGAHPLGGGTGGDGGLELYARGQPASGRGAHGR